MALASGRDHRQEHFPQVTYSNVGQHVVTNYSSRCQFLRLLISLLTDNIETQGGFHLKRTQNNNTNKKVEKPISKNIFVAWEACRSFHMDIKLAYLTIIYKCFLWGAFLKFSM